MKIEITNKKGRLETVEVTEGQLLSAFVEYDLKIFGMKRDVILALRGQYIYRRGTLPITVDKIKEVFKNGSF